MKPIVSRGAKTKDEEKVIRIMSAQTNVAARTRGRSVNEDFPRVEMN